MTAVKHDGHDNQRSKPIKLASSKPEQTLSGFELVVLPVFELQKAGQ
jgi:hypothetical protein